MRGRLPYKIGEQGQREAIPQCLFAPDEDYMDAGVESYAKCLFAPRTKHSRKPPQMRRVIEKVSHGPMIELFARYEVDGWDVWGNEVPRDELKLL